MKEITQNLERASVIWLTTFNTSDKPGSVPVWFVYHEGEIYVTSAADTKKVRKLRRNKYVLVAIGKRDAEMRFDGTCEIGADEKMFREIMNLFFKKYGEEAKKWWGEPSDENLQRLASQRVMLRIKPTV